MEYTRRLQEPSHTWRALAREPERAIKGFGHSARATKRARERNGPSRDLACTRQQGRSVARHARPRPVRPGSHMHPAKPTNKGAAPVRHGGRCCVWRLRARSVGGSRGVSPQSQQRGVAEHRRVRHRRGRSRRSRRLPLAKSAARPWQWPRPAPLSAKPLAVAGDDTRDDDEDAKQAPYIAVVSRRPPRRLPCVAANSHMHRRSRPCAVRRGSYVVVGCYP
jgi:hypothetical protein